MKVTTVIAFALFISCVYSAFVFDNSQNVTLDNPDEFKYRATTYGAWAFAIFNGAWFGTFGATVTPKDASVDAIWASAYVGTGSPPNSWIAFYDANANYNFSSDPSKINWADVDVSASAGFMGQAYLRLNEVDPQGNVVATTLLKELIWVVDQTAGSSGAQNGLYWITFKGTKLFGPANFDVRLTVATSSQVGMMNDEWLNALMTPKSLETFVKINNYPYANTANSLKLVTAVATAAARLDATGHISAGSGESRTYYNISSLASVDGSLQNVAISGFKKVDLNATFENPNFLAQIYGVFGVTAEAHMVEITFPAGAQTILLDPTLGTGPDPVIKDSTGSASGLFLSLLSLLAVVFYLF